MAAKAGITKSERLTVREDIQDLFSGDNQKVGKYPLLVLFQICERKGSHSTQVLFSVSKRKFSRAVDRNRLKRRMREAYRTCDLRNSLNLKNSQSIRLAFLYTGKGNEHQTEVNKAITKVYDALIKRITELS